MDAMVVRNKQYDPEFYTDTSGKLKFSSANEC